MRELNDLSLKEFEYYQELINEEVPDTFSILELFGYDIDKMDVKEYLKTNRLISEYEVSSLPIKKYYDVNGRRFSVHLKVNELKAGQFIDFENYMKDFKIHNILSIFLIPMKKTLFGYKKQQYGVGYDTNEVIEFLYNNFKIGDAGNLTNFFFRQSMNSLKVMKDYSSKKLVKIKMKEMKKKNQTID